jgi:hypothetical protein
MEPEHSPTFCHKPEVLPAIADCLGALPWVETVTVIQSLFELDDPETIHLAVCTVSPDPYLVQAMALRRQLRALHLPMAVEPMPYCGVEAAGIVLSQALRKGKVIFQRSANAPKRDLTPDPALRPKLAADYDPSAPLSADEWPESAR